LELDALDHKAEQAFPGHLVRKDLVRRFRGQFPVPTYVVEFMLGRYCASTDPTEIEEGLALVQAQLGDRTVRAGEEELFKARAREKGSVKLIELVTARLDAKSDSYLATLPSLRLTDVRIGDDLVRKHERMLTGGFYAELELGYDASIAQEKGGRPFEILSIREIQLSNLGILDDIVAGRGKLSVEDWKALLLRSIGLEPEALTPRARDLMLLRMVPFVERNYNMVELGPRGTGKSHLFQQVSPYAHLISGGKATVARMFVNMSNGQRGLVCQYDVVCFDEVSGVSFDQKDGVNIMKGYMESGEFSRGRESIRADGGIVLVGNFDVDVQHQQRVGHLFGPLPPEMRDDTAFMDRIHAYLPGWDLPKVSRELFTEHFGLVSDVLAEFFSRLRSQSRVSALHDRMRFGGALSGRDQNAVNKTVSGLLKLVHPDPADRPTDETLEWAVRLALEVRRRVKEQQKRVGSAEFRNTQFSYALGLDGVETFVATQEVGGDDGIGADPLPPGQVWTPNSAAPACAFSINPPHRPSEKRSTSQTRTWWPVLANSLASAIRASTNSLSSSAPWMPLGLVPRLASLSWLPCRRPCSGDPSAAAPSLLAISRSAALSNPYITRRTWWNAPLSAAQKRYCCLCLAVAPWRIFRTIWRRGCRCCFTRTRRTCSERLSWFNAAVQ
jgi:ATP-dependent Lon protease